MKKNYQIFCIMVAILFTVSFTANTAMACCDCPPGPPGEKGDKGDTGNTGATGDTGATGTGVTGEKGGKGDTGAAGEDRPKNDAGTALALAIAGARYTPDPGKTTLGISASTFAGQQALGLSATHRLREGDNELRPDFFSVSAGITENEVGATASMGWQF